MLTRLGKYEIVEKIGQGAMGEVYRAHDSVLGRDVAVKTMAAGAGTDDDLRQRFLREAQSAARLNHPNIITIHDFGQEQERMYIAMELLEGVDLKELIAGREPLVLDDKLGLMDQICDGVAFAHAREVIHRDLKPANIHILPSGQVKIMDFGLARMASSQMTRQGMILGTPYYMSPEQVRGQRSTTRSDVFALGALFYELLAGRKPFEAPALAGVLFQVMNQEPAPLETLAPGLPPLLYGVVRKALAKNAAERYADAGEMRNALRAAGVSSGPRHAHPSPSARPPTPAPPSPAGRDLAATRADPGVEQKRMSEAPTLAVAPSETAPTSSKVPGPAVPVRAESPVPSARVPAPAIKVRAEPPPPSTRVPGPAVTVRTETPASPTKVPAPAVTVRAQGPLPPTRVPGPATSARAEPPVPPVKSPVLGPTVREGAGPVARPTDRREMAPAPTSRRLALVVVLLLAVVIPGAWWALRTPTPSPSPEASPASSPGSRASVSLDAARHSLEGKEYRRAAEQAEEILRLDPQDAAARELAQQARAALREMENASARDAAEATHGSPEPRVVIGSPPPVTRVPATTAPTPAPPTLAPATPVPATPFPTPPPPTTPPATTTPPAPTPIPTAIVSTQSEASARQAIRGVLDEYRAAFERRDADALRAVQPGVDYPAIKQVFATVTGYTVRIDVKEVTVRGDTATARCVVLYNPVPKPAGKIEPVSTVFHLRKAGDLWLIERLERR